MMMMMMMMMMMCVCVSVCLCVADTRHGADRFTYLLDQSTKSDVDWRAKWSREPWRHQDGHRTV